ncbi:MAG: GNAT family N-acetyltransferase [Polyangiaceae bacterium]
MTIRLLGPNDEAALEEFLSRHCDSSMFLRSNVRISGLVYRQAAFHGQYMAAFNGGAIVSVVAHAWNGILLVQTPERAADIARAVVALSGRKVTGILGPRAHVAATLEALELNDAPLQAQRDEISFGLDLAKLVLPTLDEILEFRPLQPADRATLIDWRVAHNVETLEGNDTPEALAAAGVWFDWLVADGTARVATKGSDLISLSAFNARLPDVVQLGGIFTPPALRRRHYARGAIAASLLAARASGARRAVLLSDSQHAIRACESLGFERTGEFGLVLFA